MSKRLKIALLYLGRRAGIANHTVELARGLQGECDLVCYFSANSWIRERMEALECRVEFFPTYTDWPSFLYSTAFGDSVRKIRRAIDEQAPDFVLDTGSGPWGELLYTRRTPRQGKWARMIHDVVLHEGSRLSWRIQRLLFPLSADVMVGVSEFSARELQAAYPGQKVIASRTGVHFGACDPDPDRVAANRKNFVFFGRIEPYKGVDVLVEAYALAKTADPELRLVIAGQGEISAGVKARAAALGIVLVNDYIPDNKIAELFATAGVLVLPYLSATQSGISATGLGKGFPMVATNVGGLPEHVIDGRNGRLVPPGDAERLAAAMIEVAASEDDARKMAQASLELGRTTFEWNGIARDLLDDLTAIQYPDGENARTQ